MNEDRNANVDEHTGQIYTDGGDAYAADDIETPSENAIVAAVDLHHPDLLAQLSDSGTLSKYVWKGRISGKEHLGVSAACLNDISTILGIATEVTEWKALDDRYVATATATFTTPDGKTITRSGAAEQMFKDSKGKNDPFALAKVFTKAQRNAQNHLIPTPFKVGIIRAYRQAEANHNGRRPQQQTPQSRRGRVREETPKEKPQRKDNVPYNQMPTKRQEEEAAKLGISIRGMTRSQAFAAIEEGYKEKADARWQKSARQASAPTEEQPPEQEGEFDAAMEGDDYDGTWDEMEDAE